MTFRDAKRGFEWVATFYEVVFHQISRVPEELKHCSKHLNGIMIGRQSFWGLYGPLWRSEVVGEFVWGIVARRTFLGLSVSRIDLVCQFVILL